MIGFDCSMLNGIHSSSGSRHLSGTSEHLLKTDCTDSAFSFFSILFLSPTAPLHFDLNFSP